MYASWDYVDSKLHIGQYMRLEETWSRHHQSQYPSHVITRHHVICTEHVNCIPCCYLLPPNPTNQCTRDGSEFYVLKYEI